MELVWTPEEEEEEPWDEAVVARAQAEMLAAHRAAPGCEALLTWRHGA